MASVGAMDVINCLALVSNQLTAAPAKDIDLEQYRRLLKEQIDSAPKSPVEGLTYAQDGVLYKDGYRVEKFDDARLDQLNAKIKDLEHKNQDKEQKLKQLNVKLEELERKSVDRELAIEELRSRTVSRAESPSIPQIVLDEEGSQKGKKFRPIHRDDEFRRTVKKKSVSSNTSEDRTDEMERLTQLEVEESKTMEDFMPLIYVREEELDPNSRRHRISPIHEQCPMHEEGDRMRSIEHSPELSLGIKMVKPWGDVKPQKDDIKGKILTSRQFSIEEEARDSESSALDDGENISEREEETNQWVQSSRNLFPEVPQLTKESLLRSSETVPSNLSSHSNSPESDHPTLKRTRKKSDLTALLLDEERKGEAYKEIVIQLEEYDSDRTKQSKSPSPYVDAFLENERQQSKASTLDQPMLPKEATISPASMRSVGSTESPVSSLTDEFVKDDARNKATADHSSSPRGQPDRNVSRDGSFSFASTDASTASLDSHVGKAPHEQLPSTPPPPPTQPGKAAMADLDAGGADRRRSREPSAEDKRSTPPKRFRTRKRLARSVTPINFDQTFMDQFADQRFSVSPSELEDYINSMEEIKIAPPKPVTPNYMLPTTPMTSGVPSLMVTDDKGIEARFHDSLSSRSFYGTSDQAHPARVYSHNVNYVEWIKKFPENMTSHLELEDYDSDDEEVEQIIKSSSLETKVDEPSRVASPVPVEQEKFPVDLPVVVTPSPEPISDLPISPEVPNAKPPETHTEFPLNQQPSYQTPSPLSIVSDLTSESAPDSSSMGLGSPLLNSLPSPTSHFTPIISPIPSLKSPTHDSHSPRPLPKLIIPSRSPSSSPYLPDMTPEEMVYDIAHLDGLIFETKSRSPTPSLQTPSVQVTPLSPEELAYDIGNLGGLILGPPSRSASPLPPTSSPTPGSSSSSLSSPWTSLQLPNDEDAQNTTNT
ncbi:cell surface glycoprotein 1 isoform X3 [Toxorhynchites rutilus septentrionalis]|uniref:cell surface glycoprotein 1 isoform X2 n=1 Tax=Toxorhynchites rutilus septentrionalis TaxID=329112 RepID=UPI00247ABEB5|nr:cell surface glycoprotein 1 isoform X2 [Toxorhynchites rutilus septentrionalis]XP_055629912.1 cell surface glycoprotein 1 isoform X3 [Toxorhynchites rutilus septentrionalis]